MGTGIFGWNPIGAVFGNNQPAAKSPYADSSSVVVGRADPQPNWMNTQAVEPGRGLPQIYKRPPVSGGGDSAYSGGGNNNSGGGGGTSQDVAQYDSLIGQLQGQLGRADTGLNQGLTGLNDSFNRESSRANEQRSRALEGFETQRTDTTNDKLKAVGTVNSNARNLADSVRRILGLASGSGSSAYQFAAPNAVARTASTQRSGVNDTFGKNFRALDTAEDNAKVDFQNLLDDLSEQRNSKESGLRAGVIENKNSISQRLASAANDRARLTGANGVAAQQPFLNDINSRNAELDGLFARFRTPYNIKPVNVQTPDLAKYTTDRASINANNQGGNSPYSPYAQPLKRKFEEAI